MIGHSPDAIQLAFHFVHNPHNVCVKVTLVLLADSALAGVCAKDDMIHSGCVTHTDGNEWGMGLLCGSVSSTHIGGAALPTVA